MERKSRVLIIEDIHELADVLRQLVEIMGFSCQCASNGEEGLALLSSFPEPPLLILCDITLPGIDGFEVLRRVRADAVWSDVVFVAMSGNMHDKRTTLEMGANHYLLKPFNMSDLAAVLNTLL